jgi:hypothetical protein
MKKVKDFIIKSIEELAGKDNGDIYRRIFKDMNDKQFKVWFDTYLSDPSDILNIVLPNGMENKISVSRNIGIAKTYGIDFFKPLIFENEDGKVQSTVETFTVDMNVRIPSQTVDKGVAVSDEKGTNILTGQAKASSKITPPETGILFGLGMVETLKELHRGRGGDEGLQQAIQASLANGGEVSMESIANFATGVTSTTTLDSYFKAMHIKLFDDL